MFDWIATPLIKI